MALTVETNPIYNATAVQALPAALVRGGTSKCWIFSATDLPSDRAAVERLLIRTFGSPDVRQIDGIGGGSSTTSKAIVVEGAGPDGTINYSFAQVAIDKAEVEWASNCGNCATGLGLYALQSAMVATTGDVTRVPMLNTVTGLQLTCEVPTPGGLVPLYGDRKLDGQFYPGVPVDVIFAKNTWSSRGTDLPTGRAVDTVEIDGRSYPVTLIDAGAPAALFDAAGFGLTANEPAEDLDVLIELSPRLRAEAAKLMDLPVGLSSVPKVGIVGPPPAGCNGVSARMIAMGGLHPAIGLTSAVAIAAACGTPGSTVDQIAIRAPESSHRLQIHLLNSSVTLTLDAAIPSEVSFQRTARVISEGTVLVPND